MRYKLVGGKLTQNSRNRRVRCLQCGQFIAAYGRRNAKLGNHYYTKHQEIIAFFQLAKDGDIVKKSFNPTNQLSVYYEDGTRHFPYTNPKRGRIKPYLKQVFPHK